MQSTASILDRKADFLEKHNRKKSSIAFPAKYASFSMGSGFSIVGRASKRKLNMSLVSLPLKLHSGKCLSDSHPRLSLVKCLTIGTSPSDLQCCLNFVYAAANFFGMLLPSSFAAHSRSDQGLWFTVNFKTGDQLKKVFGESLVDD